MYSGPVKLGSQGGIPNVFQKKEYVVLKSNAVKVSHPKCTGPKIAHQANLAPIENQGL